VAPQQILRPYREVGGFECDWIDSDALRAEFPSLNSDYVGGITQPAGQVDIASRFAWDGVCMSPAAGELMAELIDTGKTPLRAQRMFERISPGAP
jgi:hypothetical protein